MVRFEPVVGDIQIKEVAILAHDIWHEAYETILSKEQRDYMIDAFQSPEAISQGEYYLLYEGNEVLGYLGIGEEDKCLLLSKIYLKSTSRGKGYLRQIVAKAKELSLERDYTTIRLYVNKENSALKAYEVCGFKNVGSVVKDIGNGYVMDDYVLELNLGG